MILSHFRKGFRKHLLSPITKYRCNTLRFHSTSEEDETTSYLYSLGYSDPALQEGMKDALKGVFGNLITADKLRSIGNPGLEALSKSVQEQLQLHDPNAFFGTVHVQIPHHNYGFELKMREGENFMVCATEGEGRELLGEYLECACGGNMSCSTCHIILDEESYSKLDPPCKAELDMLDLAFGTTDTSRLGCNIIMSKELDGMTITIPSGVNNMW
eukprot:scaffold3797_cov267-Chaetoceros_neogracile.AAC.21